MPPIWGLFLFCGAYTCTKIYQNKVVPESTESTVWLTRERGERDIFEEIDFSRLQEPIYDNHRRSLSDSNFGISAFGENYQMRLSRAESVLHPNAKIVTRSEAMEEVWEGPKPDCFFTGHVTSHNGTASFSNCNRLEGIISTMSGDLHVRELPREHNKHLNFSDADTVLMLGKIKPQNRPDNLLGTPLSSMDEEVNPPGKSLKNTKRDLPSGDAVIELAVYTDSTFTALFPSKDVSKRIELMVLKYNGVQMEFSRADKLGRNVKIQIKHMEFWDTNPGFYSTTNKLGQALETFCQGVRDVSDKYDIQYLHIGVSADYLGMAYIGAACTGFGCSVDADTSFTGYKALTHEIGHNLGMHHDSDMGCSGDDVGIMGGYGAGWSSCSINSFNEFIKSEKGQCLFREDGGEIVSELSSSVIGQEYTPDEVCEKIYGPNFRFRTFPYYSKCLLYSCVNYTEGTYFGRMFTAIWHDIPGAYCGEGKICFNLECRTFEEARQTQKIVRPGGWGNWEQWQPCSRTCGTGVRFRRRTCNNPSPINHPGCEGGDANGYEAKLCNEEPCPSDLLITNELFPNKWQRIEELRNQRASETCSKMLENGVLSSSEYTSAGTKYGHFEHGQCEVNCKTVPGFEKPTFARFGLMPHGTPCDLGIDGFDQMDSFWPRKKGLSARCLDGYCRKFGCDNSLNGEALAFDGCGVCGGDGSTCDVVKGTYKGIPGEGERDIIAKIPKGAYNIQVSLYYWNMQDNYIEMYSKDDVPIIANLVGSSWVWKTGDNPLNFADAYWNYQFWEYLYTEGTISEPVIIKLFQKSNNTNTGIQYAYSVPKSVKTCQGQCLNGGIFNTDLCTCDCPSGFYGNDCSSRCNKYCFNGATLDQSTCNCQCKENQTGTYCKCASGYTGLDCTTKT